VPPSPPARLSTRLVGIALWRMNLATTPTICLPSSSDRVQWAQLPMILVGGIRLPRLVGMVGLRLR
jgi:hypothetical protein